MEREVQHLVILKVNFDFEQFSVAHQTALLNSLTICGRLVLDVELCARKPAWFSISN